MFNRKKKIDKSVEELSAEIEQSETKEQDFLNIKPYPKRRMRKLVSILFYCSVFILPILLVFQQRETPVPNQTNITAFVSKYIQNYFYYDSLSQEESSNSDAAAKMEQMQITEFTRPVYNAEIISSSVQSYNIRVTEIVNAGKEFEVYATVDVTLKNEADERLNERFQMKIVLLQTEADKYLVVKQPTYIDNGIDLIASDDEKELYLNQYKANTPNNVESLTESELKQSKDLLNLFFELYGVDDVKVSTMIVGSVPQIPSGITFDPSTLVVNNSEYIEDNHFKLSISIKASSMYSSTLQSMNVEILNNKIQSIEMKGV